MPIHYGVLTRDYSPWRSIKYGAAAVGSRGVGRYLERLNLFLIDLSAVALGIFVLLQRTRLEFGVV